MTTPTQAASAKAIRKAALGPTPKHPNNTHVWMGRKYGTGTHPNGNLCDEFLSGYPWEYFGRISDADQRTFLLFVACALEG